MTPAFPAPSIFPGILNIPKCRALKFGVGLCGLLMYRRSYYSI